MYEQRRIVKLQWTQDLRVCRSDAFEFWIIFGDFWFIDRCTTPVCSKWEVDLHLQYSSRPAVIGNEIQGVRMISLDFTRSEYFCRKV